MDFKNNFNVLKDKVGCKASELSKDIKEVDWKQKGDTILTSVKSFDYEKVQRNIKKNISEISKSADSFIKYIKAKYKKEDAVRLMKEFDKNINSKLKNLKRGLEEKRKSEKKVESQYLLETSIIHQEREKMLEALVERTGEMNFDFDNLKFIRGYQERISEKGFRQLKNAEGIYIALSDNKNLLDDYSAVYIMYTKFLEIEISKKIKHEGRSTSFMVLLKKIERDYKWKTFIDRFNKLNIREKRNLAAHGGDVQISFEDVEEIRDFILKEDFITMIASK